MSSLSSLRRSGNELIGTRKDRERSLEADFSVEDPVVMQLGGSDPANMHDAVKIAMDYGYKEFNINVGCPSDKVSGAGCFGAVLMKTPEVVCNLSMAAAEALGAAPSIKCRIGVDNSDSYERLAEFIDFVSTRGGVSHFIVHARTAILGGKFSPKQNRTIPPLKYSYVYKLVGDFPHIKFSLNGGVVTLEEAEGHFCQGRSLAGVMVGRSAVDNPFHWRNIDSKLYGVKDLGFSRIEILSKYATYAQKIEKQQGAKPRYSLIKPLYNLYSGFRNGKKFRRQLSENIKDPNRGIYDVIMSASDGIGDQSVLEAL